MSPLETGTQEAAKQESKDQKGEGKINSALKLSQAQVDAKETNPFAPSVAAQLEGVDQVGTEVKNAKLTELNKVQIKFNESLDTLTVGGKLSLVRDAAGAVDLAALDVTMDLGPVEGAVKLPKYSLFPQPDQAASPEYSVALNGKDLSGQVTFVPGKDGVSVWKGKLKSKNFEFTLSGEQKPGAELLHVSSIEVKQSAELETGKLTLSAKTDLAKGDTSGKVEYQMVF